MRLEGGQLQRRDDAELPSEGMVRGAVQLPPGGQPVVFLADHPVTGGYPVVATVCDADVDRAAQIRPGQAVRFVLTRRGRTTPRDQPV
jgi:allophanate hydrolase subunit 2